MSIEVQTVATEAEREAIYRFRYDIYVEEMGRYQRPPTMTVAACSSPRTSTATTSSPSTTVAMSWASPVGAGRRGPFSERQVRQYGLEPFLAEIPADRVRPWASGP